MASLRRPTVWIGRSARRARTGAAPVGSATAGAVVAGDGMVVSRGYKKASSLHVERVRNEPPGYFYDVIANGFGAMPSYAAQIPVDDRWAIVAYVRALQLSQHATLADVPAEKRAELGAPAAAAPPAPEGHH